MTLDMFMDEEFKPFTKEHVDFLILSWNKMDKTHKLFEFNREWYTKHFQSYSDKVLMYHAGLGVPHYSNWAAEVAMARGIV